MKYVVKVSQSYNDLSFEFSDTLKANMFAEMAVRSIAPKKDSDGNEVDVKVTITFIPEQPKAEDEAEAEADTEKEDK